ncbi:MAG: trigger factor, partial [Chloroflexi bacterium]|nr:trigger factor [Chloroflexota bacterium]
MNVEVTKLPESRVALKVELSAHEVDQAMERTYRQLVQRVTIPGFRKGKAPRPVLERMVGHDLFVHEATEEAIRWGYRKAVDQANISPIDEAQIKAGSDGHDHLESGQVFQFEATVAVKPEVQLPDYHTVHLERPRVEVSEGDVDALLQTLRERNATLEPVVRPAQLGDVVTMNIVGRVGGEDVVNNENADFELRDEGELPDPVLPGLAAELVGANRGDIREITLPLPELYLQQELAGKTMFVRALIKEIKRKVLPPLDDDLAQSVSEFQTLEELRNALRQNLTLERSLEADERLVQEAIEAVTSRTFVEIPPLLVKDELDRMVEDMRGAFERRRLSLEAYLEATGKSEQDLRREMHDSAVQNVKTSLVLAAIADAEQIEVKTREVDAALEELLRTANTPETERRRLRASNDVRSNVRSRLRRQRAIQRLVEVVTGGQEISPEAA